MNVFRGVRAVLLGTGRTGQASVLFGRCGESRRAPPQCVLSGECSVPLEMPWSGPCQHLLLGHSLDDLLWFVLEPHSFRGGGRAPDNLLIPRGQSWEPGVCLFLTTVWISLLPKSWP